MATPFLNIREMEPSQAQVHITFNEALRAIERAATGQLEKNIQGNFSLSEAEAQHYVIAITGAPGAPYTMNVPAMKRVWLVKNATGKNCTIAISGGGSYVLAANTVSWIFSDGKNITEINSMGTGGGGGSTGGMRIIEENTSFYVGVNGDDANGNGTLAKPWKSLQKALDNLADTWINSDVYASIILLDGEIYNVGATEIKHPCGNNIRIMGQNIYTRAVTKVVSTTPGAVAQRQNATAYAIGAVVSLAANNGYWYRCTTGGTSANAEGTGWPEWPGDTYSDGTAVFECIQPEREIVLAIDNAAGIVIGDYVAIKAVTGGSNGNGLLGCHKVSGVNTGSNQITVTARNKALKAPTGLVAAKEMTVYKSVLDYSDAVAGIVVNAPYALGMLDKVVIVGGDDTTCIVAGQFVGGNIRLGEHVGVDGGENGIAAYRNGIVWASGAVVSGANIGCIADGNAYLNVESTCITGCMCAHNAAAAGYLSAYDTILNGNYDTYDPPLNEEGNGMGYIAG